MKILKENLKKAGYFNAGLIVVAIVLRLMNMFNTPALAIVDSIVCIAALIFGLFYSLKGYKKDAAAYYKLFMYLLLVSSLMSLSTIVVKFNVLMLICDAIILICVVALAVANNLGESKSNNCALIILICDLIKFFYVVAKIKDMPTIAGEFANLVLACVLCVFVSAKYTDKATRGTK